MSELRRFLFVTWDGGGNFPPELAVARRLVASGHRVRVLGDPTLEPEVRSSGAEFSPWVTAPHRTSRAREHDIIKDYEIKNPLKMIDNLFREFLAVPAPRWAADTHAELTTRPVDAVVVDFGIPAALIVAAKLKVPSATLIPNIWVIPTAGIPPVGPGFLPARGLLGHTRDALLRPLIRRAMGGALPALNAARQSYGLPKVRNVYDQLLGADQVLVQTSPEFDFTSPDIPANVRYVGPELADPEWSTSWQSPFAADDNRPLVLVGLSSMYQNQMATLRRIVQALSRLPVRGLVTLGPALLPSEVPGSANVTVVQSAPHSKVLEQASLLITHCGHGTTMKGLAAGVPLLCMPMSHDQPDTAARVVYRGAGLRLKPDASPEQIGATVERLLKEPAYKAGAARLQHAIQTRQGCADPVELLLKLASPERRVSA